MNKRANDMGVAPQIVETDKTMRVLRGAIADKLGHQVLNMIRLQLFLQLKHWAYDAYWLLPPGDGADTHFVNTLSPLPFPVSGGPGARSRVAIVMYRRTNKCIIIVQLKLFDISSSSDSRNFYTVQCTILLIRALFIN